MTFFDATYIYHIHLIYKIRKNLNKDKQAVKICLYYLENIFDNNFKFINGMITNFRSMYNFVVRIPYDISIKSNCEFCDKFIL